MRNIIFLFSLPRSGSTLLQKILMTHKDISSVAEPWLLLPFLYAYKREGLLAEYSHSTAHVAFQDFIKNLPLGERDYYDGLRCFILSLYEKQCKNGELYFLDKTPRYYLIISEIVETFPDAKFIFLFRNPIQILASIIETWGRGKLRNLYGNWIDVYKGPQLLAEGYIKLKERAFALRYEDFVLKPERHIVRLFDYLELEPDMSVLNNFFKQDTKGRLGDTVGVNKYRSITSETLEKWKKVFSTPLRKMFLIKYVKNLDEKAFTVPGYNMDQILNEIDSLEITRIDLLNDCFDFTYAYLVRKLKLYLFFGGTSRWVRDIHVS